MQTTKPTTLEILKGKILDPSALIHQLARWRFVSKKIVFTNGCFDILHLGHIDYLAKAADLGDILVVGLNSDASTRELKGTGRPINGQEQRAMILASLHFVDCVTIFDQPTPLELIKTVEPDVLVKGGDYEAEKIAGYDVVKAKGGQVKIIDFLPGYSTTGIEEKIKSGIN